MQAPWSQSLPSCSGREQIPKLGAYSYGSKADREHAVLCSRELTSWREDRLRKASLVDESTVDMNSGGHDVLNFCHRLLVEVMGLMGPES